MIPLHGSKCIFLTCICCLAIEFKVSEDCPWRSANNDIMITISKCHKYFLPWPCLNDLGFLLNFWCFLLFFPRFDRPCPCDFATSSKNISSSSYDREKLVNFDKQPMKMCTGGTWRCLLIGLNPPNSGCGKLGKLSLDCLWDGRLKTVDGGPGLWTGVDPGNDTLVSTCH